MSEAPPVSVVLDAGVVIAQLDHGDALHQRAVSLLESLGRARLVASVLTVAECLVPPAKMGAAPRIERALASLGLEPVALEADDAAALATVRADTGLRMPDAAVVHAAEKLRAGIATSDRALARAARDRGLVVLEA